MTTRILLAFVGRGDRKVSPFEIDEMVLNCGDEKGISTPRGVDISSDTGGMVPSIIKSRVLFG